MNFYTELISIMGLLFLALISPGPDTIMILRQCMQYGRKTAIFTSIGIGLGILVHVSYILIGIGLIISQSIILFNIIKIAGGLYLLYIGWQTFKSKPKPERVENKSAQTQSSLRALWLGFLTNVINPKATIFLLSLFTVVINPNTPLEHQAVYGIIMSLEAAIWFIFLSYAVSYFRLKSEIEWLGKVTNRLVGGILMILGIKLALTS